MNANPHQEQRLLEEHQAQVIKTNEGKASATGLVFKLTMMIINYTSYLTHYLFLNSHMIHF